MTLQGMRVAVLATDGVEQSELIEPVEALHATGAEVELISIKEGQVRGYHHSRKGEKFDVDYHIRDVQPDDYDAVVLPGGARNADRLRRDEDLQGFLRAVDRAGKPIAAICHAPWELVASGLVQGRRLTSYPKIDADIRAAGGDWVDQEVVVNDNWVSSRCPADLPAFNKAMLQLFKDYMDKAGLANPYSETKHLGASHPGIEVDSEAGARE